VVPSTVTENGTVVSPVRGLGGVWRSSARELDRDGWKADMDNLEEELIEVLNVGCSVVAARNTFSAVVV
jgi:hypothetical protein